MKLVRVLLHILSLILLARDVEAQDLVPCDAELVSLTVSDTTEALELSDALNCTGAGEFHVIWTGHVEISQTFRLSDGATLSITSGDSSITSVQADASSPSAVVDGGGVVQLFSVLGGSKLNLNGVSLMNSIGNHGAAVHAERDSEITIFGGTIAENHGTSEGKAFNLCALLLTSSMRLLVVSLLFLRGWEKTSD